jgi:glycosyltransferase involved in cell wall biosynthesis
MDYRRLFARIPNDVPVVMTLHDMNHFTGGCHYDAGCGRFTGRCGTCPLLGSTRENDLSRLIWRDKAKGYHRRSNLNLRVVADSRWLAGEARRSLLLGRFQVETIHYGLDETLFRPIDRQAARKVLNLPDNCRAILFVADSIDNPRKGLVHLLRALERFPADRDILLLSVGNNRGASLPTHLRAVHLGYLKDDLLMAAAYSAANVFVIPSMQEAFGQTALESVACGTPVVGFQVGGIPDIVQDGLNGRLVPAGDDEALYSVIAEVLDNAELAAQMSAAGRNLVTTQFTLERQAKSYIRLYEEMLASLRP